MPKQYFVYILTDDRNKIFYTGMTDDVVRRNAEHKWGWFDGFTKKYCVHKLVYYEIFSNYSDAAHREKLIKRWKRAYKIENIEKENPMWDDLFYRICGEPDPAASAGVK
jgi:putative endonuclease